ncbi:unnamed protein product [Closterium sp. NIES-54]
MTVLPPLLRSALLSSPTADPSRPPLRAMRGRRRGGHGAVAAVGGGGRKAVGSAMGVGVGGEGSGGQHLVLLVKGRGAQAGSGGGAAAVDEMGDPRSRMGEEVSAHVRLHAPCPPHCPFPPFPFITALETCNLHSRNTAMASCIQLVLSSMHWQLLSSPSHCLLLSLILQFPLNPSLPPLPHHPFPLLSPPFSIPCIPGHLSLHPLPPAYSPFPHLFSMPLLPSMTMHPYTLYTPTSFPPLSLSPNLTPVISHTSLHTFPSASLGQLPPVSARSMAAALPVADPVLSAFNRLFCCPLPRSAVQPHGTSSTLSSPTLSHRASSPQSPIVSPLFLRSLCSTLHRHLLAPAHRTRSLSTSPLLRQHLEDYSRWALLLWRPQEQQASDLAGAAAAEASGSMSRPLAHTTQEQPGSQLFPLFLLAFAFPSPLSLGHALHTAMTSCSPPASAASTPAPLSPPFPLPLLLALLLPHLRQHSAVMAMLLEVVQNLR